MVPRRRGGALIELPIGALRPAWFTHGALKFGVLCAAIAAISMLSPRISSARAAGVVSLVGLAGTLVGAGVLGLLTRRLARHASTEGGRWSPGQLAAGALLSLLRGTGLPLLGLAFFLVWTFVYLGMYWHDPGHAFGGLGERPRYSDLFYYSVSTGLISPPGDIVAATRGARSATVIEMLTGLALITTYLSSFASSRAQGDGEDDESERGARRHIP